MGSMLYSNLCRCKWGSADGIFSRDKASMSITRMKPSDWPVTTLAVWRTFGQLP